MSRYVAHVAPKNVPQSFPVIGKGMVKGDAGGFVFAIDDWERLNRFLILGNENGTYYASERKLTAENAQCVLRCAEEDPVRAVNTVADISVLGKAPKNDPAVFALALLTTNPKSRELAYSRINDVCRTGTHLLQFVSACDVLRGWGSGLRRCVGHWFNNKNVRDLSYQVTKYQSRDGWAMRDVLRLSHPKPATPTHDVVYNWVTKGWPGIGEQPHDDKELLPIWAFEKAKKTTAVKEIVRLICDYRLPRECIPTQFLNSVEVWEALLRDMPMTAMIRNLGKMTNVGLLKPLSSTTREVVSRLTDTKRLKGGRIHPMSIFLALKTYSQGHGDKGKLTWGPIRQVVDALDDAFYLSFGNVEPTGKNRVIGLDVSGSMASSQIMGTSITAREASAAMALITVATEPNTLVLGFTGRGYVISKPRAGWGWSSLNNGCEELSISPKQRLDDVINFVSKLPMGPTDCALPMRYCLEKRIEADSFEILTDNESWQGDVHPFVALKDYRQKMGRSSRFVACAFTATEFSIADPNDALSMNCVGLDSSLPQILADFVRG